MKEKALLHNILYKGKCCDYVKPKSSVIGLMSVVHPKMNIESFTHPYCVPNKYDFFILWNTKDRMYWSFGDTIQVS